MNEVGRSALSADRPEQIVVASGGNLLPALDRARGRGGSRAVPRE